MYVFLNSPGKTLNCMFIYIFLYLKVDTAKIEVFIDIAMPQLNHNIEYVVEYISHVRTKEIQFCL